MDTFSFSVVLCFSGRSRTDLLSSYVPVINDVEQTGSGYILGEQKIDLAEVPLEDSQQEL